MTVPGDSPSAAPGSCGDSVVGRMELGLLRALGMGPWNPGTLKGLGSKWPPNARPLKGRSAGMFKGISPT